MQSKNKVSTYAAPTHVADDRADIAISRTDLPDPDTPASPGEKVVIRVTSFDNDGNVPVDTRPDTYPEAQPQTKAQIKLAAKLKKQEEAENKRLAIEAKKIQARNEKLEEIHVKQRQVMEKQQAKERAELEKREAKAAKKKGLPMTESSAILAPSGVGYVYFTDAEKKEIRDTQQIFGAFFTSEELRRMYARFKENGKVIHRNEFTMIYAMFGRNVESSLAFRVFDLFDAKQTGAIGFLDFVHFMAVVLKGTPRQKMEYTFRLFDRDGDGNITREDLTDILTHLPIQKMLARRKQNVARLIRRKNSDIMEPLHEDEETDEAEERLNVREKQMLETDLKSRERLRNQKEQERVARSFHGPASVSSLNSPPSPGKDPRNQLLARRIAEEVFDDAQCGNYINLIDFMTRVAPQESMQAFFPF